MSLNDLAILTGAVVECVKQGKEGANDKDVGIVIEHHDEDDDADITARGWTAGIFVTVTGWLQWLWPSCLERHILLRGHRPQVIYPISRKILLVSQPTTLRLAAYRPYEKGLESRTTARLSRAYDGDMQFADEGAHAKES